MTSKQRAYLKSLAMKEDAILQIGKQSVTPELTQSVDEALEAAADAVEKIVAEGPDAAMNTFNKKRPVKES